MLNIHQVPRLRRAVDPAPEIDGFDPVTGLPGRELFCARIGKQWDWSLRKQSPISLLLINLDHFKRYQDTAGETGANRALGEVGEVIATACRRRADLAGRTRLGEFGVMLSECALAGAEQVAQSIRTQIDAMQLDTGAPSTRAITVSVGGTFRVPTRSRFQNSLLIDADRALAQAKAEGRDCVRFCCD